MEKLISVVVPIYNQEKWLAQCIESILDQPYQNIEILLIDDGSTDTSFQICEHYNLKDHRVKVVKKTNGGVSSARNTGIIAANGSFITFIDPDDTISYQYFTDLYSLADKNECEVVVCGYTTFPTNKHVVPGFALNKVMTGKELILSSRYVHSNNDLCFSWRYFYNLDTLRKNNSMFNEQLFIGEDVIFNLEVLAKSKRVIAVSESYYKYTINNPESVMRTSYKPQLLNNLSVQYEVRKIVSADNGLNRIKTYRNDLANYNIKNIYALLINNLINKNDKNHYEKEIREIVNSKLVREGLKEIGFSYNCKSIKEYIYFLALKYKIYTIILSVFKKQLTPGNIKNS
ncbi:glycosyltransferase [Metabacillus sp. GX 13764]|uniref:glycosyltransferase n=1 Tax=Metabacillus kandeliae TaxID=2900151 RepID=UPI001E5D9BF8|nr:glycosyltransferase [Metabacillus kandeliae]MCD7033155.1 glycosyltransferase [Metabacillus kandeliae]